MGSENEVVRNNQERIIQERDSVSPSPSVRAQAIWNILNRHNPRPTLWDLVCFSIETLTLQVEQYPFLRNLLVALNSQIYKIHYNVEGIMDSFVDEKGEFKK